MNIQALDLVVDLNHDGTYSGWELWEAIKFLYRLPGNLITEALGHTPYVSSALGIQASEATGYGSLNGLLAVTISLIFWVLVVFALLTLASPDSDQYIDTADTARPDTMTSAAATDPGSLQGPLQHNRPAHESATASDDVTASPRGHLPVSRPLYAAPGKRPKRRRIHHLAHSFIRPAK
ncbi:MAG TPA: hypothetical protein VNQ97_00995 [Burkholderiaceae bacterium]|nr:hypothetical protein [Burkholderiaceae bacterium]